MEGSSHSASALDPASSAATSALLLFPSPATASATGNSVTHLYEIIRVNGLPKGPYKVKTRGYAYQFHQERQGLLIAYHWHPGGESSYHDPHMHAPAVLPGRIHFPGERTSMEKVVRFCITELGVEPIRDNWAAVLTMNEDLFETYRTWPAPPRLS